jgi:hypothetical protein
MNFCFSILRIVLFGVVTFFLLGSGLLAQEVEVKVENGIPK